MTYECDSVSVSIFGVLFDLFPVGDFRPMGGCVVNSVLPEQVVDVKAFVLAVVVRDAAAVPCKRTKQSVK